MKLYVLSLLIERVAKLSCNRPCNQIKATLDLLQVHADFLETG